MNTDDAGLGYASCCFVYANMPSRNCLIFPQTNRQLASALTADQVRELLMVEIGVLVASFAPLHWLQMFAKLSGSGSIWLAPGSQLSRSL